MERLFQLSISQIHEKLVGKEVLATEVAEAFLQRIKEKDGDLNAFITQTPELALEQARHVDEKIAKGEAVSALAGIPCAVKDSILLQGVRCTAASKILENYVAPYDATVIQKLKEQDVVFIGKTNTDEFNMGASTENSAFGPTKNPYDLTRVAGGSSGGSAAAVAATEAHIALGEDTGGSIRLPAAFCGIVGLKPTYGAVSRHGVIGIASSLDQVGPMARTAEDAEAMFQAMCGKDELDATSLEYVYEPMHDFDLKKLRIGVPKEYFGEGLAPEVKTVIEKAIGKLKEAGAQVKELSLPTSKYALAAYYIINPSEISANLARYDGIRYGAWESAPNLLDTYRKTRGKYFGAEVKRRIMLGTYALSAGYYDAYYLKAQKIRSLLKREFDEAFQNVDVIAGPVSPTLPFKIGEKAQDPLAMYLVDLYTVPVNLAGLPALSLPAGRAGDLPVGLHLIAKPLAENLLFATAKTFEKLL